MRPSLVAAIVLFAASPGRTADPRPVEEIKISGVKIGASYEEFDNLHSNSRSILTDSDRSQGVKTYVVESRSDGSFSMFKFYKGKLFYASIEWDKPAIRKIGGHQTLIDHMAKKYGPADATSDGVISKNPFRAKYHWKGTESYVLMEIKEEIVSIAAADQETMGIMRRMAK